MIRRSKWHIVILGCLPCALPACWNLAVGPANPRPNVLVPREHVPAKLVLEPSIPDDFTIPGSGSVNAVPVTGWRQTLTAGFRNAFQPGGNDGPRLELLMAELSFAPAAISTGGTAAVRAHVRYKARLLSPEGKEVRGQAGTVQARAANTSASPAGMTGNAGQAVEALYEELAAKLLVDQAR